MQLDRIGQIAIPVMDIERSIAFYRDTLGMKFLFKAPPALAFFMCGDVRLMLSETEAERFKNHSSVLYYKVADIQASFAELKGHAVKIESEPHLIAKMPDHDLWMGFFYDPDDNLLALMSEVREGARG